MQKDIKVRRVVITTIGVVVATIIAVGVFVITSKQQPEEPQHDQQNTTSAVSSMPSISISTQTTEPKHEHRYTTEKKAATCTEGGYTLNACACGDTYRSDEKKAKGHQYGAAEQTEATCTAKGGLVKTCKVCGHKDIANAVAALGHKWTAWETTREATTSSSGEKVRTCDRCNKTEKKTIAKIKAPAHKHSYTQTVVEATCVKKGYTLHTCACGKSYKSDTAPLRSHLYGDWVTVKKPTATKTGKKEATCQWCGKVVSNTIPKLSDEDVELYKKYIDPKIEISRTPDGARYYQYKDVVVIDVRTWGDPPYIKVVKNNAFHIIYAKKDGTKVELNFEPIEGYIRRLLIKEDGSYFPSLIGDFND